MIFVHRICTGLLAFLSVFAIIVAVASERDARQAQRVNRDQAKDISFHETMVVSLVKAADAQSHVNTAMLNVIKSLDRRQRLSGLASVTR